MTFKLAVVEDNPSAADELKNMIERYEREDKRLAFDVDCYADAQSFLTEFDSDYDAIFLDIQMPNVNGMDAARRIREKNDEVVIVFVTNMAQYALESYEVHAYDFILKPLIYDAFAMKFKRICNKLGHNDKDAIITLVSGATKKQVRIIDITFAEVSGHNLAVHMVDGEFRMRGSMGELEKKLAGYHFVRCNACYLVNLKYVSELRGDFIVVDGNELRVSHLKKTYFLNEFAKYMGGNS